ncbi:Acid_phosphatase [Hexamita inflata]|uniref:Acid phosphatase n=1 Tax=Hexamita inflata TaxID=28002 RepID=A0AA86UVZ0_9EUKA|nr:Acid phosphatase [Hexamita inflata]
MFILSIQDELKQAFILTRHGMRTPLKPFPNDPGYWACNQLNLYNFQYKNENMKPTPGLKLHFDVKNKNPGSCFTGQLSDGGYQQHLELSKLWGQLYGKMFTNSSLRSTSIHRVRMSLNGQLNDLNSYVNQASVPSSKYYDSAKVPSNCSWFKKYQQHIIDTMEYHLPELNEVRQKSGWLDVTWEHLSDDFKARRAMQVKFPEYLTQEQIQLGIDIDDETFRRQYYTESDPDLHLKALKVEIGPYMEDLMYYLQTKKFHITSGHDTSVGPLAGVLIDGGWAQGQVRFASFINVEVWDVNGAEVIKVRFRDGPDGTGDYYVQKACGKIECTKNEFLEHIQKFKANLKERDTLCNSKL